MKITLVILQFLYFLRQIILKCHFQYYSDQTKPIRQILKQKRSTVMIKVFKVLAKVIQRYSRLSAKDLFDVKLKLELKINIASSVIQKFISSSLKIPNAQQKIFMKNKRSNFILLNINHSKYFPLSQIILKQVPQCIIFSKDFKQQNNIIYEYQKTAQHILTKGIIFQIDPSIQFEELIHQIDAFLAIIEIFHSHIHLIFTAERSHHSPIDQLWQSEIVDSDQEDYQNSCYIRILQERGNRITLSELSDHCEIQRFNGGEMLIFEEGADGILIWFTQNYLPILEDVIKRGSFRLIDKYFTELVSSQIGYALLKPKSSKQIEDMAFTTIIFNFNTKDKGINKSFIEQKLKSLISKVKVQSIMSEEEVRKQKQMRNIVRLSQLLEIDSKNIVRSLYFS